MSEPDTATAPINGATMAAVGAAVIALFLAILALGAALAANNNTGTGGGVAVSGDGLAAPAEAVTVELSEFAIGPDGLTVAEGGTLEIVNSGAVDHNLAVRDAGLTTPDLGPGASGNGSFMASWWLFESSGSSAS